jgi:hypothetical protein
MTPTLLVLAGYLAAEIFLRGYAAAGAVMLLGLGEYSFMLVFRKKNHPSLIVEGAVLAGIGALGVILSGAGYPGAEFVLLELILGGVLVGSTMRGRPWLATLMKRMALFPVGMEFAGDASMVIGTLFILHGTFMGAMLLVSGSIPVPLSMLVFALLYASAVFLMRRRLKGRAGKDMPVLISEEYDRMSLELAGRRLGSMELDLAPAASVSRIVIPGDVQVHELLDSLEKLLRSRGCRALRITDWTGDGLPLEMNGYTRTPAGWNKML